MSAPTEKSIRRRVGTRSFERGDRYFRLGQIHDARRSGDLLRARCHGSDDHDYRVEVRVHGAKVITGRCSCPVGADGTCKHVAAVLLNWRERPADFQESAEIAQLLGKRTKAELIDLITALVDSDPMLAEVIESVALPENADARSIEKSAAHLLELLADGADPSITAMALQTQVAQAARRMSSGDVVGAAGICQGIAAAAVAHYGSEADVTGDVARVIDSAGELLTRCFTALPQDGELRRSVLKSLFTLLQFDVCIAGAGLAGSIPEAIDEHASRDEVRQVIEWVREVAAPSRQSSPYDKWQRECWGALIADLVGDELTDDEYLEHCRQFGLMGARVARLLELNQFEEAVEAGMAVDEPQLPEIAELFVQHGRDADAVTLMQCRAADSPAAAAWLMDHYEGRGEWTDALEWRRHEFEQQPDLLNYRAVQRAAVKAKRWPELANELLEIAGRSGDPQLRVRILLDEGRVADAAQELEQIVTDGGRVADELFEDVARASEKDDPERAIELYVQVAESLIEGRRSRNYVVASELLKRVQGLYEATGRPQEWHRCITGIASRHARRRALQQQLRRAKLL